MAAEDVLVHIHVWKTAGTSIAAWLRTAFPDGYGFFYPKYVFDEASLQAAGLGLPHLRALSSHSVRHYPAFACGRRMHYFTLLRNPIACALSLARYRHKVATSADVVTTNVTGSLRTMQVQFNEDTGSGEADTRAAVALMLDELNENTQTNFIALHAWCASGENARGADPEKYPQWPAEDLALYRGRRLEFAKNLLRDFIMVGTVERLPESLELLRRRAAVLGFALPPPAEVPLANATPGDPGDLSWIAGTDPLAQRLIASLTDDFELFLYAEKLLKEALATPG